MFLHFILARLTAWVRWTTLVVSLIVIVVPPLIEPAKADEGVGINGGVLADAGAFHIEFIGGAAYALMIFAVSDQRQKPIPSRDIRAYAVIAQNGKTTRLRLSPDADNLLATLPALPLLTGTGVLVVATLATGETLKARFISP